MLSTRHSTIIVHLAVAPRRYSANAPPLDGLTTPAAAPVATRVATSINALRNSTQIDAPTSRAPARKHVWRLSQKRRHYNNLRGLPSPCPPLRSLHRCLEPPPPVANPPHHTLPPQIATDLTAPLAALLDPPLPTPRGGPCRPRRRRRHTPALLPITSQMSHARTTSRPMSHGPPARGGVNPTTALHPLPHNPSVESL